ncbi:cytochrome ubiquinol oxidase subunit I [Thermoflavifilum thermophilum]|uniref:Cytochrome bd-I ubiquinol oxidase subunit 1 apoprotein n=1 Tax=Thermoflavifilum thermophilum TaxID=1393122 RepID=A0A1I7NIG0_9BACT|nr:cytochrome ubiquinol oxidase subunit I [Thermoflavifilum thermophilum]SFV34444.1 cytochrome bd-I ubiquinol oxidase subunit 1 apoprotein [Thermoflavifilum thermophilum]
MDDFLAARAQMGVSLGFHIIFACIGMVMPFFMAVAHYKWLRTGDVCYKNITRAWSRGVAIFFVTGAVSGTMLSFELGLLWPGFMKYAGPIIGMPFSLEGTAFFIEAIALGFYLYGWEKLNRWFHWYTGLLIGLSGLASGILVVSANAWMNSPAGFTYENGHFTDINPWKAMYNAAWIPEALHMILAAFIATGFAVAGVHAWMLYRGKNVEFHLRAFRIAVSFAAIAALLQPFSGDFAARSVAKLQPAKLAAMEGLYHTQSHAPLSVGGIWSAVHPASGSDSIVYRLKYAIEIPDLLSVLVHGKANAEVIGLDRIPKNEWPLVGIVHIAYQIMVALGILLFLLAVISLCGVWKYRKWLHQPWFLKWHIMAIPGGFLAIEAGWTVTEVGRQPWIIDHIMRTADAVTPMPGIVYTFYVFTGIYLMLSAMVIFLLYRQIKMVPVLYDVVSDKN